jgi:hypothetical protein
MKTKKFNKKLVLNKSTIADLAGGQMNKVKGGETEPKLCYQTQFCTTLAGHICDNTCACTTQPPYVCQDTCDC